MPDTQQRSKEQAAAGFVRGSLDAVRDGWARGWAQAIADPAVAEPIKIIADGVVVAEGVADQFREDLSKAGIGDGRAAFNIPLPPSLRDGRPHTISAEAAHGVAALAGSPTQLIWHPPFTSRDFDERGPWIDRPTYRQELARRLENGSVTASDAELLHEWQRDGVLILRSAIEHSLIDQLWADVERAWRERVRVRVNVVGLGERELAEIGDRSGLPSTTYRIMNFQDFSEAAARILLHPRLTAFLRLIFDARPVGMQTLMFEYGSEQRGHMDFAYVHTRNPAYLAAAWVACEDVTPDSGPLFYYLESHRRIPKHDFGDGNILAFGAGEHTTAFEDYLEHEATRLGLERLEYCPRKGDVLLWHSALVHGGSRRLDPSKTRRSFVAHYSTEEAYPEDSRTPGELPNVIENNGGVYYAAGIARAR